MSFGLLLIHMQDAKEQGILLKSPLKLLNMLDPYLEILGSTKAIEYNESLCGNPCCLLNMLDTYAGILVDLRLLNMMDPYMEILTSF